MLDREQPADQGGFRRSAKAFDTMQHEALWNALARFEVEAPYISILKRSYADQQTTVSTDKESDMFKIQRVTKQGDLCFNTVLQSALEDDLNSWHPHSNEARTWMVLFQHRTHYPQQSPLTTKKSHMCHRLTMVISLCGFLSTSKIPLAFARLHVVLVTDFFHVTMLLLQFQVHLFFTASSPRDHELVFRETCDTVFLLPSEDHLTHECA